MKVGRKPVRRAGTAVGEAPSPRRRGGGEAPGRTGKRRPVDTPGRPARTRPQESRGQRPGPQSIPAARPPQRPARPKSTSQAKARAKARKAKAPKVIRPPLRERLLVRLASFDLSPRALIARIPFVVLVIGALAVGLGLTLWLSTDAAQRSYQLGSARALNEALIQQKEALERDVLEAQSAPALADAARDLGMIPSRDTAHLVKDPAGNWVLVGEPKAAEGAPPPPLNTKLPDEKPPAPGRPEPAAGAVGAPAPGAGLPAPAGVEVPVLLPPAVPASPHAVAGPVLPGPPPAPGPVSLSAPVLAPEPAPVPAPALVAGPEGDTLVLPPAGLAVPGVPTVTDVSPVTVDTPGAPPAESGR